MIFTRSVSPDSFPAVESFTYVIVAMVGGLGTVWGGVVGAVLVSALLQVLNTVSSRPGLPPAAGPAMQYATYGAARRSEGERHEQPASSPAAGHDRDVTLLYLIKQVELAVRQALDDVVAAADLTALQYTALTVLERHPGMTSAELARNSFVRAQSMAEMVTYLLGRGLVTRERDQRNRKQYLLSLSRGRAADPRRALRVGRRHRVPDARGVRRRADRDPAHLPRALPPRAERRHAPLIGAP